jgi:hypothetical protein
MYNITLWHIHITIVATYIQQCILRIAELKVTFNNIRILSVAQKCIYGEFMLPATKKNILRSSCKMPSFFI